MHQFARLTSEQVTLKRFSSICRHFGLFLRSNICFVYLREERRNSKNKQGFNPKGADIALRFSPTDILIIATFWLQNSLLHRKKLEFSVFSALGNQ